MESLGEPDPLLWGRRHPAHGWVRARGRTLLLRVAGPNSRRKERIYIWQIVDNYKRKFNSIVISQITEVEKQMRIG